jgi:hypothetical protein
LKCGYRGRWRIDLPCRPAIRHMKPLSSASQSPSAIYLHKHTKFRISRQGATFEIYEKSDVPVRWIFLQYVSPSPNKRRAIDDWRCDLTISDRADFDNFLRNLTKKSKWSYPDIGALSGHHLKGFYEFRWKGENGVPHRVGGYFSANNAFVMLIGFTHNRRKYVPAAALESLIKRKNRLRTGEATLCEYSILTGKSTN